jgi:hypothetical protein
MTYQTPQFMADLLRKVQVLQLVIARKNDGHSLHVDLNSIENHFFGPDYHIMFSVALLDDSGFVKLWYFSSTEDADVLDHTLKDLAFEISRL